MKNKNLSHNNTQEKQHSAVPDLDIIDLEGDFEEGFAHMAESRPESSAPSGPREKGASSFPGRILSHINIHIILLIVAVIFVAGIAYTILNWGVLVDIDDLIKSGNGTYEDVFDSILPLTDSTGNVVRTDYSGNINILVFGNAPFADDRDSDDSLASMIQEKTGATVYNCAVSGSYLAAEWPYLSEEECPIDIFNFYWMCFLPLGNSEIAQKYLRGVEVLGDDAPKEAMEVYQTLTTIDLGTVDVVVIMYDGSDYLAGHEMYSDENATDINQFTGNMEAGIELLQAEYPNIRFMVLSPPYAFGIDENGEYISSDIQRYGWDVLSTYVIKQAESCHNRSVTFVDNLYGTINEDNAKHYLIDHLHMNVKGREKVAQRFADALYHYQNYLTE